MNVQATTAELNTNGIAEQNNHEGSLAEDGVGLTADNLRAREILDLLKAKRERYTGRLKQSITGTSFSPRADDDIAAAAPCTTTTEKPPLSADNKGVGVPRQDSIDRRKKLHRGSQKSPTNSYYSLDGSEATKHSAGTRSTVATEESYSASSPGSCDGMINRSIHVVSLPRAPMLHEIREVGSFNGGVPKSKSPLSPAVRQDDLDQTNSELTVELTLDDNESCCSSSPSFHDDTGDEIAETGGRGTRGGYAASPAHQVKSDDPLCSIMEQRALSSNDIESTKQSAESCPEFSVPMPKETVVPHAKDDDRSTFSVVEPELAHLLLPVKSFEAFSRATASYAAAVMPPHGSFTATSKMDMSTAAKLPLSDSVPVTPTTPRNFDDKTSRPIHDRPPKLLTFADVHIPRELAPSRDLTILSVRSSEDWQSSETRKSRAAVRSRRGHSLPARRQSLGIDGNANETELGTDTRGILLNTKEERSVYIGRMYGSDDKSVKGKMITPPVTPSSGLRRHERECLNHQLACDRHGSPKNANQESLIAEKKHFRNGNMDSEQSRGRPSWERQKRTSILKHKAIDKELLDISIVNDHEKRRQLLRRLQEDLQPSAHEDSVLVSPSRSASPSSSASSDYIEFSDDSSCDLTTSSELTSFKKIASISQPKSRPGSAGTLEKQAPCAVVQGPVVEVNFLRDKDETNATPMAASSAMASPKAEDQHNKGLKLTAWNRNSSRPVQLNSCLPGLNDQVQALIPLARDEDPTEISMFSMEASPELGDEVDETACQRFESSLPLQRPKRPSASASEQPLVESRKDAILQSSESAVVPPSRSPMGQPGTAMCETPVHCDDESEVSALSNGTTTLNIDRTREKVRKTKGRMSSDRKSKTHSVPQKRLFVTGRAADAQCMVSGGHFDLAIRSGMVLDSGPKIELVRLETALVKPPVMQLSTDFRCGTYGSLYDIAVRSGCQVHEPNPSSSRRSQRKRQIVSSQKPSSCDKDNIRSQRIERGKLRGEKCTLSLSGRNSVAMPLEPRKDKPRSPNPLSGAAMEPISSSKTTEIVSDEIVNAQCGASCAVSMLRANTSKVSRRAVPSRPLYAIEEVGCFEVD